MVLYDVTSCMQVAFLAYCRIDSNHNGEVVKAVCNGLGDKVTLEDVRCEYSCYLLQNSLLLILTCSFSRLFLFYFYIVGMSTYRRSLRRIPTESEREKKLQRSRQQRVNSVILYM